MQKANKKFQFILTALFTVICLLTIFPFLLTVSVSISNEGDIVKYGYSVFPKNIDFSAYKYIFRNYWTLLNAYKVTAIFSFSAMFLGVMLMSMIAYALSRKDMKGGNVISFFLYFTMLFSGGLVPTYILITQYLHLNDTIWVYILPGLISPWYVFMIRTFFKNIPEEIIEAVMLDGASEFTIYSKIVVPLSKPVLATVALFTFLTSWNDWYNSMLYINDESLISLQYLLQRIMQNITLLQENSMNMSSFLDDMKIPSETVRMAMAVVVAGPALLIFPFFQKYFVQGLTIGGVKG